MSLLAGNCARKSYSTRPEAQLMRSDRIGRQVDDTENGAGSGISDKINARPIPVIVEVSPLQGI